MQLGKGAVVYSLKKRLKWNKSSCSEADICYRLVVAMAILCASCVPSWTEKPFSSVTHAIITSCLDSCNVFCLKLVTIQKLYLVQNTAALIIMDVPNFAHVTCHYLPINRPVFLLLFLSRW